MNSIYLTALLAGAAIATQAAMNAQLGRLLGSPLLASCVAFGSGIGFTLLAVAVSSRTLPSREMLAAVPYYLWFAGGLFSAFGISVFYLLIPKIGLGQLMALGLTGQLLVAVMVGHFGWFEVPQKPLDGVKLAGLCALVIGVLLINWERAQ